MSEELRHGFTIAASCRATGTASRSTRSSFRGIRSTTGEGKDLVTEIGRQCMRDDMAGICSVLAKLIEIGGAKHVRLRVLSGGQDGNDLMEAAAHWS